MLRWLKWVLICLVALFVVAELNFHLPRHTVVRIVGTETKRFDSTGYFDSERPGITPKNSRDVRIINTAYPDESPMVFRNEDTAWTFPFYFKFNSGDIQAEAQNLQSTRDKPRWVLVTSYGWRFTYLTMFPNAVSLEEVSGPDAMPIPWFNIIFLTVLAALVLWLYILFRRFKRRRIDPMFDQIGESVESAVASVHETGADISTRANAAQGRFSRWLDSWKPKNKRS